MIAGATERHRQTPAREQRQHQPELARILAGKERGQRRFRGVVDHKLGLEAIERVVGGEGARGLAQLVGLGDVFGIVDDDMGAAHEGQRVVDRLGLGARHAVGHLQQLEARIAEQPLDRGDGPGTALLDDKKHLKLLSRVVERRHGAPELRHHLRLVAERDEHGVDRQLGVGEKRR